MARVFISYRREDSSGHAGRLYDYLATHFGEEHVFIDVDTLRPGEDFVDILQRTLAICDVVVAVIGQRWLTATDETGRTRLDNPQDVLRIELMTALERGVPIVPVLVDGSQMPPPRNLPAALVDLARYHALDLPHGGFRQNVHSVIDAVEAAIRSARESRRGEIEQQLLKSAAEGSGEAMHKLGVLYASGDSVEQNYELARQWYEKAAAAGNRSGMCALGDLYADGHGVEKNITRARELYQRAASVGSPEAMCRLGWMYADRHRDHAEAERWFRAAIAADSTDGMFNLARFYEIKTHRTRQQAREVKLWYEKAAARGSAKAMYHLGQLYEGFGFVKKDYQRARDWYRKAAEAGESAAAERLQKLQDR